MLERSFCSLGLAIVGAFRQGLACGVGDGYEEEGTQIEVVICFLP